jgi:predicted aspartyl protease
MRMRCLGVVLALTVAVARLAAIGETDGLPFRLLADGAIVVPVSLDGGAVRPFLLDTGASRSAIASDVAARLALTAAGQATVLSAIGTRAAPLVRLDRTRLGTAPSVDVTALVLDEGQLGARAPVDGLIGLDVLAARAFTVDYRRGMITWLDAREAAQVPGARVPLSVAGGCAVITLAQAGGGALRLIPDTGTDRLVLFADGGRVLPDATPLGAVRMRTVAGDRLARRVSLDQLEVGAVRLLQVPALLIEGAPAGVDADGLLPLHLFARVTVDGPGGWLIVEP